MIFSDKYISASEAALDTKTTKVVIGDDAYAIGEILEELKNKIEILNMRLSLK